MTMTSSLLPVQSAVPEQVRHSWTLGDGPSPCAWLGMAVAADQAALAAPGTFNPSGSHECYGSGTRLPKRERSPVDAWLGIEGSPSLAKAMSVVTTMPYKVPEHQRRALVKENSNVNVVVFPGLFAPVGVGDDDAYELVVSIGWLASHTRMLLERVREEDAANMVRSS